MENVMYCRARSPRDTFSLDWLPLCAFIYTSFFSILRVHTLCVRVMFIYLSFVRNLFFVLPSFSSVGRLIYRAAGRPFKNGDFTLCTFFSIFSAKMKRKKEPSRSHRCISTDEKSTLGAVSRWFRYLNFFPLLLRNKSAAIEICRENEGRVLSVADRRLQLIQLNHAIKIVWKRTTTPRTKDDTSGRTAPYFSLSLQGRRFRPTPQMVDWNAIAIARIGPLPLFDSILRGRRITMHEELGDYHRPRSNSFTPSRILRAGPAQPECAL